ncbi:MAG: hypothetical protein Q9227_000679 [Pyrenula ochraceoflavens]
MGDPSSSHEVPDIQGLTLEASTPTHSEPPNIPLSAVPTDVEEALDTPNPSCTTPDSTPPTSSSENSTSQQQASPPFQFGTRFLPSEATDTDIFVHNAWDHVQPDSDYLSYATSQYALQRSSPVSDFDRHRFNSDPQKWWDRFYKQKTSTFFKDRKWLQQEFPLLREVTRKGAGEKVVLEVGAGAGNTAFPILRENENTELKVWACDFSKRAVETMRNAEEYDEKSMRAEIWDVAGEELPPGLEEESVDVVVMIFIFSALEPKQWDQAVKNLYRLLKPGGQVLFRDYGRGDLAQVRFKKDRWMGENFYVRGDGTRVYFFEKEELERIWGGALDRLRSSEAKDVGKETNIVQCDDIASAPVNGDSGSGDKAAKPNDIVHTSQFDILNLDVDRRMIVNRSRRIKMYRCWIQGRFKKPI